MKAYVLHENPLWIDPFRRAMAREGVTCEEWILDEGAFDLEAPPPEGVFLNRASPSSHTRGHHRSVAHMHALLVWLEAHERRVINGSRAFALEMSKLRQYAALRACGIATPRTIPVIGGPDRLVEAARALPAPFIIKHDRGGSGRSVRRFDSHERFEAYVRSDDYEAPVDHVNLLQEYVIAPEPWITRVELVDGEFVFAMKVDTSHGYDLCPADPCRDAPGADRVAERATGNGHAATHNGHAADRGAVTLNGHAADGPADVPVGACPATANADRFRLREDVDPELIESYRRFVRAAGLDIAGIEFIEDERGRILTYDVNATTNYSESFGRRHGVDGHGAVAALLARELAATGVGR